MPSLTPENAVLLIVLLPLLGAAINGLLGRFLCTRTASWVACGSITISFLLAVQLFFLLAAKKVGGAEDPVITALLFDWIAVGDLNLTATFRFDSLSAVMTMVVTGVGSLIHYYSTGYMAGDPGYKRYFSYLNLFSFSMLTLVLGDNLGLLFLGWEGVGLCSYLLIGFWFEDKEKAVAGQKAFVVNRIGDFGFLLALLIVLFYTGGSLDYSALKETFLPGSSVSAAVLPAVTLLLFLGATGKSAQIPLYMWLPDAMAGPTPVSALIHAATMVTAGVYMVCRLHFLYIQTPYTMALIALVGGATALFAATIALTQRDIKKVLAYSTVSQLGYMFLGAGVGAFSGAIFHLTTHAFFKGCLFLGAGVVIHALHGEQDGIKMGGLRKHLPTANWTFLASTLAIAGFPLLAGFWSKDEILWHAMAHQHNFGFPVMQAVAFGMGITAALLTAFYMGRLYLLIFNGKYRGDPHDLEHLHMPNFGMKLAIAVLGVLSIFGGLMGTPFKPELNVFARWLDATFASSAGAFSFAHGHTVEHLLMGGSALIALLGLYWAWSWYKEGPGEAATKMAGRFARAHALLLRAYRVDDLVEILIKRPFGAMARFCYGVLDAVFIDGLAVHGSARLVAGVGGMLRWLQTGHVQEYALGIALGTAALLYFVVL